MTEQQLREWMFSNSLEDSWFISINGVTHESTFTLDSAIKTARRKPLDLLHISQSTLQNPPWIALEVESKPDNTFKLMKLFGGLMMVGGAVALFVNPFGAAFLVGGFFLFVIGRCVE